jgi:mannose-6-phosphate isomerase-like protein (cupin superfamily)
MHEDVIQTDLVPAERKEWGRMAGIVNAEAAGDSGPYSVSLIEYEAPHFSGSHDDTELIFLLSGRGKIAIGDRTASIQAGSLVTIPKMTPHGIVEVSEAPIKALLIHVG